jgi:hypothetical protein
MRCLGMTIMLTLVATTYATAQACERPCSTRAQTLPAQDGKP